MGKVKESITPQTVPCILSGALFAMHKWNGIWVFLLLLYVFDMPVSYALLTLTADVTLRMFLARWLCPIDVSFGAKWRLGAACLFAVSNVWAGLARRLLFLLLARIFAIVSGVVWESAITLFFMKTIKKPQQFAGLSLYLFSKKLGGLVAPVLLVWQWNRGGFQVPFQMMTAFSLFLLLFDATVCKSEKTTPV